MEPENLPDLDLMFGGVTLDVPCCPRCEGDHPGLVFTPFKGEPDDATHWAMCPTHNEPVLMDLVLL